MGWKRTMHMDLFIFTALVGSLLLGIEGLEAVVMYLVLFVTVAFLGVVLSLAKPARRGLHVMAFSRTSLMYPVSCDNRSRVVLSGASNTPHHLIDVAGYDHVPLLVETTDTATHARSEVVDLLADPCAQTRKELDRDPQVLLQE